MKSIRNAAAALALVASLVTTAPTADATPKRTTETPAIRSLGIHPYAALQSTRDGARIVELEVHGGELFAGYGDANANTGPIQLASVDPATGEVTPKLLADTEAIYNLRSINGRLWAPSSDPRVSADYAADGPWVSRTVVGATHVLDMATLNGDDLWMVGSQGLNAMAWRSVDGGQTWTVALRVAPVSGRANDSARFWGAGVLDGRLYLQGHDVFGGSHPTSKVFDGNSWTDGPALADRSPMRKPLTFGGSLVYRVGGVGEVGEIRTFDGTNVQQIGKGFDLEIDGDRLVLLDSRLNVRSTVDLAAWDQITKAPRGTLSIAVAESEIFFGTVGSEILRFSQQ